MRVLVLASTFPRWRADNQPTFIFDLCRHLPNCEVHVLAPGAAGAKKIEVIDNVHIHRFSYAPAPRWQTLAYEGGMLGNLQKNPLLALLLPIFLLAQIISIVRLQRTYQFDVIHAHWIIPQGLCAVIALLFCRRQKPKLVVTAHGADVYAVDSLIGRAIKRFVLRRAQQVTAVSSALADSVRLIARNNLTVSIAPMGIALLSPSTASARHGFCFVGRFVEKKGVLDLIDAWAEAQTLSGHSLPPLAIAGDGPLRSKIQARIAVKKLQAHIQLTGWLNRQQVTDLIASSECLLMPSRRALNGDHEGLGLVVAEALALGTPVIAYDFPALNDIAKLGQGILRVKEGDVSAFAATLAQISIKQTPDQQPILVVDENMHRQVRDVFSWSTVGKNYRSLYGAALK